MTGQAARVKGAEANISPAIGSAWLSSRPGQPRPMDAGAFALVTLPTSPFWARRYTRFFLDSCRGISEGTAETAELLVSELVTNAVLHARPDAAGTVAGTVLRLEYGGGWLRIEVHDTSPHAPRPRTPDWLDESGFGLMLVDSLATKWGVQQTAQGKAVWAELDARPGGAAE